MNHPPRKSKRPKSVPAPTWLTRRDKLQICGVVAFVLLALASYFVIRIRHEKQVFSESLHRTINGWRKSYNLDDTQVTRIIEIEFAFHGNGNLFTKPTHTPEETDRHHQEIAAVMKPEDGERFLAYQLRRASRLGH